MRRRRRRRYHLGFMGMLCVGKLPKKTILVMDFSSKRNVIEKNLIKVVKRVL